MQILVREVQHHPRPAGVQGNLGFVATLFYEAENNRFLNNYLSRELLKQNIMSEEEPRWVVERTFAPVRNKQRGQTKR